MIFRKRILNGACLKQRIRDDWHAKREKATHLIPSLAGSTKRLSRVGLPGS
jgi:hypothetical protein